LRVAQEMPAALADAWISACGRSPLASVSRRKLLARSILVPFPSWSPSASARSSRAVPSRGCSHTMRVASMSGRSSKGAVSIWYPKPLPLGPMFDLGGRAYAFETTVAKERAQNIHAHDGVTEDAFVARRTMERSTRRGFFCPRCRSICALANCRRPSRTAGVISRSRSRLQLFDLKRFLAHCIVPFDRHVLQRTIAKLNLPFSPGRYGGIRAIRLLPRGAAMSGYKSCLSCLFAEGWPSGLRQRS
jgi:hypothetical protein